MCMYLLLEDILFLNFFVVVTIEVVAFLLFKANSVRVLLPATVPGSTEVIEYLNGGALYYLNLNCSSVVEKDPIVPKPHTVSWIEKEYLLVGTYYMGRKSTTFWFPSRCSQIDCIDSFVVCYFLKNRKVRA